MLSSLSLSLATEERERLLRAAGRAIGELPARAAAAIEGT